MRNRRPTPPLLPSDPPAPRHSMAEVKAAPYGANAALCMACDDHNCNFQPREFPRRECGPHDILIDMRYCGVCHSDLHVAANHLPKATKYPCVPGHELAGVCVAA